MLEYFNYILSPILLFFPLIMTVISERWKNTIINGATKLKRKSNYINAYKKLLIWPANGMVFFITTNISYSGLVNSFDGYVFRDFTPNIEILIKLCFWFLCILLMIAFLKDNLIVIIYVLTAAQVAFLSIINVYVVNSIIGFFYLVVATYLSMRGYLIQYFTDIISITDINKSERVNTRFWNKISCFFYDCADVITVILVYLSLPLPRILGFFISLMIPIKMVEQDLSK